MKIRQGFVSNSSSSSFIIVGTWDDEIILKLIKKMDILSFEDNDIKVDDSITDMYDFIGKYDEELEHFYGIEEYGGFTFIGNDEGVPQSVGINPEKLLETMTLPQIREKFKKTLKDKYDIDINIKNIRFEFGEVCTG